MARLFSYKDRDMMLVRSVSETPSPDAYHMHNHTNLELYCFLRGKGVYHIEGSEYLMEPGDVLIMHPSESHYIELDCTVPYERIVMNFGEELLQPLDPEGWLLRPFRQRPAGKFNLYKSVEFPGGSESFFAVMMAPDGNVRMNILSGLLPLLNQICRLWQTRSEEEDAQGETAEYRIIRYVSRNLTRPLSLDEICERFYISKSQLQRLFKKATGTTLWQYVTIKRLTLARQLLSQGEQPTHIYTRCGFSDYSTFYRAYTKAFGTAPGSR